MKLSKLIYLCIKNVNYFDDSLNINDIFDESISHSTDYSTAIRNVDTPLNEAIQRLSDMEKIPYKIVNAVANDGIIDLTLIENANIKEVISVANNYERIPFAPYGLNKIRLLRPNHIGGVREIYIANDEYGTTRNVSHNTSRLLLEYKEEIPELSIENLRTINIDTPEETIDGDIELSTTYGINNAMCQYIIEYCQGKLEEQIDPSLANMHLTRAEQYFSNLKMQRSAFTQEQVHKKYTIQ